MCRAITPLAYWLALLCDQERGNERHAVVRHASRKAKGGV
jgi:hypothetical protein